MNDNLIKILLSKQAQDFIELHENDPVHELVLKFGGKTDLPIREIAEQIECRRKARRKLPYLSRHNLLYRKTALEQASSELTAEYKASKLRGNRLIDLTGGLGVDSIYFADKFDEVFYCEINEELAEIASANFRTLGKTNIQVIKNDGIKVLKGLDDTFLDCIYIDPSRRDGSRRSVDIKYMQPEIPGNLELCLQKANTVCVKLAPAFDIDEAFRLFPELKTFEVISVNNECKEVLLYFCKSGNNEIKQTVSAVMLNEKGAIQTYRAIRSNDYMIKFTVPQKDMYLYDPDAAIKKAGLSGLIADRLNMSYISNNSSYLISLKNIEEFTGRKFIIINVLKYNPKDIQKYLGSSDIETANIARSDFPYKPEELKKILGLRDGGNDYLFFTKDMNQNLLFIHCRKTN